ncbi:MAG: hypothetical protein K0R80_2320 [Clostridia bacterium]|jgi:hypothetical protein|nr:hypothetical protein [Clostridia bacterium]
MKKIGVFLVILVMLVSMAATSVNINAIAVDEIPEPQSIIVSA